LTPALVDDQLLSALLRGRAPKALRDRELCTTGYWYVRLCQAVLGAAERTGALSRPFGELPPELRERAVHALLELPDEIGLVSLRQLGPAIGRLRQRHQLNILSMEALAAAQHLGADVHLGAASPRLEAALRDEGLVVRRHGRR
jgi:hypothetical protein